MRRILLSLALVFATSAGSLAAPLDIAGRYGIGLETGFMKLVGGDVDHSNVDQHLGFSLRRGLSARWTLSLGLKYGFVRPGARPGEEAGFTFDSTQALYTVITEPHLAALYRLRPAGGFSPVLGLGIGAAIWSVRDERGQGSVGLFPDGRTPLTQDAEGNWEHLHGTNLSLILTLGAELFVGGSTAVEFGVRQHLLSGVDRDNIGWSYLQRDPRQADENNGLSEFYLGLTVLLGKSDRDGDGIPDHRDICPGLAEDFDGFEDADGCPDRDNDADGIPDLRDDCPDQPEDQDGFQDQDGCPEIDNDQDGIIDARDDCPDEPEDRDGFQDKDGCPDPDNDGDGVPDGDDDCPATPAGARVDERGCPVTSAVPELEDQLILEGVTFRSGSAELTPESLTVIQDVAASLIANPWVRIEVRGHTDSAGAADLNRDLGYRRALTVRETLIRMGVDPGRITAAGYGEDFPIASNETPEGRAANRRVELRRIDH
jgi:outer membrane protein OmpA-like peptidoglycan-associated protein